MASRRGLPVLPRQLNYTYASAQTLLRCGWRRYYATEDGRPDNSPRPLTDQQYKEPPSPSTTAPDVSQAIPKQNTIQQDVPPADPVPPPRRPADIFKDFMQNKNDGSALDRFRNPSESTSELVNLVGSMARAQGEQRQIRQARPLTGSQAYGSVISPAGVPRPHASTMRPEDNEYHLHFYAHKHNTHVTFTNPKKDCIISMSTGDCGFKKSNRAGFDAAYTLASTVFSKIEQKMIQPRSVELIMRGFGPGREACLKALMGREGRYIRPVISKVTDSTRLKFGGTRSPATRRL